MDGRIATAEVDIDALPDDVWFALTDAAAAYGIFRKP